MPLRRLTLTLILLTLSACTPAAPLPPSPAVLAATAAAAEPASATLPPPTTTPIRAIDYDFPTRVPVATPRQWCSQAIIYPVFDYGAMAVPAFAGEPGAWRLVYGVYGHDSGTNAGNRLLSVALDGSELIELAKGLITPGVGTDYFSIHPDASQVFYWADPDGDRNADFYVSPVMEAEPLLLGEDGGYSHEISPDGSRALFWQDNEGAEAPALISVATDGSESIDLTADLAATDYDAWKARFILNGEEVLFHLHQPSASAFAARPARGGPIRQLTPYFNGYWLIEHRADASYLTFESDFIPELELHLYSVSLADGTLTTLDADLGGPGGLQALSADGAWAVFTVEREGSTSSELYSVPLDGSHPAIRLGPPESASTDDMWIHAKISPDSRRVVYAIHDRTTGTSRFFTVPLEGGASVQLTPPFPTMAAAIYPHGDFEISPDSTTLLYMADLERTGQRGLYAVSLNGGESRRISGPVPANTYVSSFDISPDGLWVAYHVSDRQNVTDVLWLVSSAGGPAAIVVSNETGPTSSWIGSSFSPDSQWLAFESEGFIGAAPVACATP